MEDIFTEKDLIGEKVMVTAGPTTEYIDPVSVLQAKSSGKMGYSIAKIAKEEGRGYLDYEKTYVAPPRTDIRTIEVETACEMRDAVMEHYRDCSIIIKAAAVADFKMQKRNARKSRRKATKALLCERRILILLANLVESSDPYWFCRGDAEHI